VAAAELGYDQKAYDYFSITARMDLDDINGNVEDGVHTAAMAGTWISIVHGFAGMRDYDAQLSFSPRLPSAWRSLRFRLKVRGRLLEVLLTRGAASFQLLEGAAMTVTCRGAPLALAAGPPSIVDLTRRLECVVFDLDGVLTDTAELHYQAWARLSKEQGFPFDRAVNEHLRGVGRQDSLRTILRHAGIDEHAVDVEGLAERKNGYYRELIETLAPGDLLPGVDALLRDLRRSGIRIAIASASRNAPRILELLGIRESVDFMVDAAAVLKGKPDPEIFFRAAEGAGVPIPNCAGVEDAAVGIQAIRAAGMFAVGIGSSLTESDWVLPDTSGLTIAALKEAFEAHARA
jgi:alpha,alpha-trehalose phosphorylase